MGECGKNIVSEQEVQLQKQYIDQLNNLNQKKLLTGESAPKYNIKTFGCQMNENDSEKMAGMLEQAGYVFCDDTQNADVVLLNTCCVRENAELKIYGHLGELKHLKKKNPNVVIGICGCMTQQQEVHNHIKKTFKHVDLIFGNANQYKLPQMIYNKIAEGQIFDDVGGQDGRIAEGLPLKNKFFFKAYVTAMYGCNNFCSYCIVPYVRGRERSRQVTDIINEITQLAKNGCKEVTILGQNVNSYGKDLSPQISFANLLCEVAKIEGIERIRFMTSHPKDISDELINVVATESKICKNIHLPLQSGSTKVLKEMNRHYTKDEYLNLVKKIRESYEGITISTDIIVGFPGETEQDFEDTLDVFVQSQFEMAFTFIYSRRTGTPAASREDQVDEGTIHKRFNKLMKVQNEIIAHHSNKLLNTEQIVLVEGESREKGIYTGRTDCNKVVNFSGNDEMIGKFYYININKVTTWALFGDVIEEKV